MWLLGNLTHASDVPASPAGRLPSRKVQPARDARVGPYPTASVQRRSGPSRNEDFTPSRTPSRTARTAACERLAAPSSKR